MLRLMRANENQSHHSAEVDMRLFLNGDSFIIAQMGPDFLILQHPAEHPPARAEVMLSIDGHEKRWPVWLPEGLKPEKIRTPCAKPGS
jgi:hypothetical protein